MRGVPTDNTVATNYDSRVFESPFEFDPDRWLAAKPRAFAMLTFGAGPRNCAGQRFAQLNLKCFLSVMLREFNWTIDESAQDMGARYTPNLCFGDGVLAHVSPVAVSADC